MRRLDISRDTDVLSTSTHDNAKRNDQHSRYKEEGGIPRIGNAEKWEACHKSANKDNESIEGHAASIQPLAHSPTCAPTVYKAYYGSTMTTNSPLSALRFFKLSESS